MNPKIIQELFYSVLWIRKDFFRIRVDKMVAYLAPDQTPGSDPSWIFSSIFKGSDQWEGRGFGGSSYH